MADQTVNSFRMNQDTFKKFQDEAKNHGITVNGNSGETETHGIKFKYNFDGSTLTITTVDKPFFVTYAQIDNHLNNIFMTAQNTSVDQAKTQTAKGQLK